MSDVKQCIETKLAQLQPTFIEVEDESHGHNVAPGAQSHFKVTLVSSEFAGVLPVKRHQKVYQILADELAGSVHALALHLYTPEQWAEKGQSPESPACMGGSKRRGR